MQILTTGEMEMITQVVWIKVGLGSRDNTKWYELY